MKKFIYLISFNLVTILIILKVFDYVVPFYYGNLIAKEKFETFKALEKTPKVVFFGASRIHNQVNPTVFDSVLGIPDFESFNFGIQATFNPEAYFLVDEFLSSKLSDSIKFLIIEVQKLSDVDPGNSLTTRGYYWLDFSHMKYIISYLVYSELSLSKKIKIGAKYSRSYLFKQIDITRLKLLLVLPRNSADTNKGFKALKGRADNFSDHMTGLSLYKNNAIEFAKNSCDTFNIAHFDYLMHIKNKAKTKGITTLFFIPPRLSDYTFLNGFKSVVSEKMIIDLSSPEHYPSLYLEELSYDRAHLNENGAIIFSSYFADCVFQKIHE